ncbi:MAG: hypothetical protein LBB61_01245 [Treponema sp.]|jgi:hypothetical protein|nr:hypothetical protein [Treponema sp.]
MADFIPAADADFAEWVKNFGDQTSQHQAEWGLPLDKTTALKAHIDAFLVVFEKAVGPEATKGDIALKTSKRKALTKEVRDYKNKYIDPNDAIGVFERDLLRLPQLNTDRTPKPAPKDAPECEVSFPGPRRVHIRVRRAGSKTWRRDPNAAGAVIVYDFCDEPPVNHKSFTNSLFCSKPRFSFEFQEEDRGKKLYFSICWQAGGGDKSPWSDLEKAVVP